MPFFLVKVMEDDQEIAAYMFRRTVPSMHLTPDDVRWMVPPSVLRYLSALRIWLPYEALMKRYIADLISS